MSTGYSWEGIRQVRATLLGARHVPEHLRGGLCLLGALYQVFDFYLYLIYSWWICLKVRKQLTWLLCCKVLRMRVVA